MLLLFVGSLCSSSGRLMVVLIREIRIMLVVMKMIRLCCGKVLLFIRFIGIDSIVVRVIVLCMLFNVLRVERWCREMLFSLGGFLLC